MISKYLIITPKRLYFTSFKSDFDEDSHSRMVQLEMPVESYDTFIEKIFQIDQKINIAALEPNTKEIVKTIFRDISRYAVLERDRVWLFEKGRS